MREDESYRQVSKSSLENMESNIKLNFNRKDFEEIYFRNKQGNLFFSLQSKTKTITTIIIGFTIFVTFLNSYSTSNNWGFFYMNVLLFVVSLINLLISINQTLKWKKQVKTYLDKVSKSTNYEMRVNDNFLSLKDDESETIVKWSEFKKAEIKDNYIALEGLENFLLPKKSMSETEYSNLKEIIRKNLK